VGGQLDITVRKIYRHQGRVTGLFAILVLLFVGAFVPLSSASDFEVDKSIQTRETVEKNDFDGFICDLKEGDKMSWYITLVSDDLLDIYVMAGEEYDKLKSGGSPIYFSQLSKDNVDFDQNEITGTANYLGQIVLVVETQGTENSSSVYDIEVKIKRTVGPTNFIDQICGLGAGICAILIIGGVVVVVVIYYIFRKFMPDERFDRSSEGPRSTARPMDGMLRPGFDVVTGPAAEPPKPKASSKKGKGIRRSAIKAVVRRPTVPISRPARPKTPGRCPKCGERADEDQGFCPSCGEDLE